MSLGGCRIVILQSSGRAIKGDQGAAGCPRLRVERQPLLAPKAVIFGIDSIGPHILVVIEREKNNYLKEQIRNLKIAILVPQIRQGSGSVGYKLAISVIEIEQNPWNIKRIVGVPYFLLWFLLSMYP